MEVQSQLADLDGLNNDELTKVAQFSTPDESPERLQYLLEAQRQRMLTGAGRQEVESLVYQEDLQTLRKAKALYLLKERNALPSTLAVELSFNVHPPKDAI